MPQRLDPDQANVQHKLLMKGLTLSLRGYFPKHMRKRGVMNREIFSVLEKNIAVLISKIY